MRDARLDFALDSLARLHHQRQQVEANIAAHVRKARAYGASWDEIGAMLGVTKQAARQRYREVANDPVNEDSSATL